MKRFVIHARLLLPLGLGALATLVLLVLLGWMPGPQLAHADPGSRYVAPAGLDAGNDCSDSSHPCATIQHAVDAAVPGDVVKIATGVYSDVHGRLVPPGYPSPPAGDIITQVVYLSKSLTLRGGYTTAFTDPPDPDANPTTLDARGEGRVLLIAAPATSSAQASRAVAPSGQAISPTLEGLRITAGGASGLGGGASVDTAGGGVYVLSATVMISDCHLFGNAAVYGGGLYLSASAATLVSNTISSNSGVDYGGGLYLIDSAATFISNTISANSGADGGGLYVIDSAATLRGNSVSANHGQVGGGLFLRETHATLDGNTISANTAWYVGAGLVLQYSNARLRNNIVVSNTVTDVCGGLYLWYSAATLSHNTISYNRANDSYGGGVCLRYTDATLLDNVISDNFARGCCGGLRLQYSDNVTLIGNTVSGNSSIWEGGGLTLGYSAATLISNTIVDNRSSFQGGGLSLWYSAATLSANTISANTADYGGGLHLSESNARLVDNVVSDNQVDRTGSGLYIRGGSPLLLHTTLARNRGGDGSGIYVTNESGTHSTVALTNTILVSQVVGIHVTAGNTATLAGTLWGGGAWANGSDWGGAGTILPGTANLWGDPAFVDPDHGDYRIGAGSPAVDAGLFSGVTTDIDGDPRPAASGYDLGADERPGPSLHLHKAARPPFLNAGQTFTYTLLVTSAGVEGATNVRLTDTLPAMQRALAIAATQGGCLLGGGVALSQESNGWGGTATCDLGMLAPGESARVTLTVQVTRTPPPELPWPMRNVVWVKAAETTTTTTQAETLLHDCHARLNDDPTEYSTVQAAVDASTRPGDLVKVAGYCTGVTRRARVVQVVYLSKTLTLQGGWNTTFTERDVVRYPTTLDAQGRGRVLYIAGPAPGYALASGAERREGQTISPTVEGFWITGGDASGLGGGVWGGDAGAGLYLISATARISDNLIFSNTADDHGGGLYLYDSAATISGNTIFSNAARSGTHRGTGGGLYLYRSPATLSSNTITSNTASSTYRGNGGGLYLDRSPATLTDNIVSSNIASSTYRGDGGGLYLDRSPAMLTGNIVSSNTASGNYQGYGGGLYLDRSPATLSSNNVFSNTASYRGGGLELDGSPATLSSNNVFSNTARYGGGLSLSGSAASLSGNVVSANIANDNGGGLYLGGSAATLSGNVVSANIANDKGGGLYLSSSAATLSGNVVFSNTAGSTGGGQYLEHSDAALSNNIVTDNRTETAGSGLYIRGSSPRLLHTTLARNRGGDGSGIYVTDDERTYSTVALTNTILVSQAVGISVTAGNAARLEGTLWGEGAWANAADWAGAGTILTSTVNLWGDPDFLDPDNGDYHIGPASAAIDAGVDAGVSIDIDDDPRPWGAGYDIGADEYRPNQAPFIPSQPTPAHGATGVPLTQTLSWHGGDPDGDPVTYAIAFGSSDPPPLVATTPITGYTPALVADTTYYWTVSASDGVSLSLGPLWRFTTRHTLYLPLLFHRFP